MRTFSIFADISSMIVVGALVYFGWSAVMAYLPFGLADDFDSVLAWIGDSSETSSRRSFRWLAEIEWLIGAVLVVLLFWVFERIVNLIRPAPPAEQ